MEEVEIGKGVWMKMGWEDIYVLRVDCIFKNVNNRFLRVGGEKMYPYPS